jgi:hypothetical protein
MSRFNDLTGATFGRLTVIKLSDHPLGGKRKRTTWLCECACGNFHKVMASNLVGGLTQSCGCASVEHAKANLCRPRLFPKKRPAARRLWSEDVEEFLSS